MVILAQDLYLKTSDPSHNIHATITDSKNFWSKSALQKNYYLQYKQTFDQMSGSFDLNKTNDRSILYIYIQCIHFNIY